MRRLDFFSSKVGPIITVRARSNSEDRSGWNRSDLSDLAALRVCLVIKNETSISSPCRLIGNRVVGHSDCMLDLPGSEPVNFWLNATHKSCETHESHRVLITLPR